MMSIGGVPFIDFVLKLLAEQGIREVVLSVAHLGRQIEEFAGDGARYNMSIKYAYDGPNRLGTGGAVKAALDMVPEVFAILYGDTFLDIEYMPIYETFKQSGKDALMTVLHNKNSWDRSNILFENGVIQVYDKVNQTAEMHHIDYGLSILRKSCFADFPHNEPFDLSDVFIRRIQEKRMAGYEVHKRFYEIGTPSSLLETEQYLLNRKSN